MNLPKLRSEQPGQASVLIAGCSSELTDRFSRTVIDLGHRAFLWDEESAPPELVVNEQWHVAICGQNLNELQRSRLEQSSSDTSQFLRIARDEVARDAQCLPENCTDSQLRQAVSSAIELALLSEECDDWRRRFTSQLFRDLVCLSPAMQSLQEKLLQEAGRKTPLVLLTAPGTDDRGIIWTLHQSGTNADSPCLTLDCETYSSISFEQELFDAKIGNEGRIPSLLEQLDGGTLLLKHANSLAQSTQKKLIRFLESPAIARPESHTLKYINIHWCFSFATENWPHRNSPLSLYLNERSDVTKLELPTLAERRDDLRELSRRILAESAVKLGQLPPILSQDAWELLEGYSWPGNEDQLQRTLSQITQLNHTQQVTAEIIRPWLDDTADEETSGTMSLAEMERQLIEATFNRCAGNRERTAQALGIGLRTLSGKLRSYGYPPRGGPGSNRRRPDEHQQDDSRRAA
jgi:DNA-binding NtrC family response regulator